MTGERRAQPGAWRMGAGKKEGGRVVYWQGETDGFVRALQKTFGLSPPHATSAQRRPTKWGSTVTGMPRGGEGPWATSREGKSEPLLEKVTVMDGLQNLYIWRVCSFQNTGEWCGIWDAMQ